MKFVINVKPRIVKAHSKDELISKIRNGGSYGWSVGSEYGSGLTTFPNENRIVRVYNLHKVNRKVVQEKYKKGEKNGQTKKSKVIEQKHWIAYVYDFNIDMLKMINMEVRQDIRNFKIQTKKR